VQVAAPGADNVAVSDPAAHTVHDIVDTLVYCPGAHNVQLEPPSKSRVSVIEPALHARQLVWPLLF
jgi:hypothetical protein